MANNNLGSRPTLGLNHLKNNNRHNNRHHQQHQQQDLTTTTTTTTTTSNNTRLAHSQTSNNNNNNNQNSISNGQQQQITGAPLDAPADCTIACDEGHLTAHKLILCDHSKYLQDILSKFPTAEHPIIILTELNIMDIRILVNYMYTGELVITSDSSPTSLLRAAQILKIDSLTDDEHEGDHSVGGQPDGVELNGNEDHRHHQQQQLADEDIDGDEDDGQMADFELDDEQDGQPIDEDLDEVGENDEIDDDDDAGLDGDDDMEDDEDDNNNNNRHRHHNNHLLLNNLHLHNNNNSNQNHNARLINSIRNIYNLQFMDQSPQQLPMSLGENTTTSSKSDFGSNSITSNHLDLDDLQDSRPGLDNKNNKIRCHLCNIGLSDVKCLYRHVLTRHLPEKWGYKCEFCDREFSRDDHLMRHYTTKHKNMEFNREKIRETRRLNREMAKNFHDQISTA